MNPKNYQEILRNLASFKAKLIVVSKYRSFEEIETVRSWGQHIFGENRVQELVAKKDLHGRDILWHLIGTLQKNKVKALIPFVDLIHSVDSLSLLQEINKQAEKNNQVQDCLLQIKIAEENTKQGLSIDEVQSLLASCEFTNLANVQIIGIMGMATNTENKRQIKLEFKQLRNYFEELKKHYFSYSESFNEISAGMSDDYEIALDEGSTYVRIGSLIFNS
jgi:pyridoxal phosphate enzyme (YggS family)